VAGRGVRIVSRDNVTEWVGEGDGVFAHIPAADSTCDGAEVTV